MPHMKSLASEDAQPTLVGLSGPTGAGKTTAGLHLRSRGFAYARYSQVVERIARAEGKVPTRSTLQEVGREIHDNRGQAWLGRELLSLLPQSGCMVADGLRYPEDHFFFVESFGPFFCHVSIDAPPETRRERFLTTRPIDDFDSSTTHRSESDVPEVVKLAHRVITNDGSLEQFLGRVELVIYDWLDSMGLGRECIEKGLGQFAR